MYCTKLWMRKPSNFLNWRAEDRGREGTCWKVSILSRHPSQFHVSLSVRHAGSCKFSKFSTPVRLGAKPPNPTCTVIAQSQNGLPLSSIADGAFPVTGIEWPGHQWHVRATRTLANSHPKNRFRLFKVGGAWMAIWRARKSYVRVCLGHFGLPWRSGTATWSRDFLRLDARLSIASFPGAWRHDGSEVSLAEIWRSELPGSL